MKHSKTISFSVISFLLLSNLSTLNVSAEETSQVGIGSESLILKISPTLSQSPDSSAQNSGINLQMTPNLSQPSQITEEELRGLGALDPNVTTQPISESSMQIQQLPANVEQTEMTKNYSSDMISQINYNANVLYKDKSIYYVSNPCFRSAGYRFKNFQGFGFENSIVKLFAYRANGKSALVPYTVRVKKTIKVKDAQGKETTKVITKRVIKRFSSLAKFIYSTKVCAPEYKYRNTLPNVSFMNQNLTIHRTYREYWEAKSK